MDPRDHGFQGLWFSPMSRNQRPSYYSLGKLLRISFAPLRVVRVLSFRP